MLITDNYIDAEILKENQNWILPDDIWLYLLFSWLKPHDLLTIQQVDKKMKRIGGYALNMQSTQSVEAREVNQFNLIVKSVHLLSGNEFKDILVSIQKLTNNYLRYLIYLLHPINVFTLGQTIERPNLFNIYLKDANQNQADLNLVRALPFINMKTYTVFTKHLFHFLRNSLATTQYTKLLEILNLFILPKLSFEHQQRLKFQIILLVMKNDNIDTISLFLLYDLNPFFDEKIMLFLEREISENSSFQTNNKLLDILSSCIIRIDINNYLSFFLKLLTYYSKNPEKFNQNKIDTIFNLFFSKISQNNYEFMSVYFCKNFIENKKVEIKLLNYFSKSNLIFSKQQLEFLLTELDSNPALHEEQFFIKNLIALSAYTDTFFEQALIERLFLKIESSNLLDSNQRVINLTVIFSILYAYRKGLKNENQLKIVNLAINLRDEPEWQLRWRVKQLFECSITGLSEEDTFGSVLETAKTILSIDNFNFMNRGPFEICLTNIAPESVQNKILKPTLKIVNKNYLTKDRNTRLLALNVTQSCLKALDKKTNINNEVVSLLEWVNVSKSIEDELLLALNNLQYALEHFPSIQSHEVLYPKLLNKLKLYIDTNRAADAVLNIVFKIYLDCNNLTANPFTPFRLIQLTWPKLNNPYEYGLLSSFKNYINFLNAQNSKHLLVITHLVFNESVFAKPQKEIFYQILPTLFLSLSQDSLINHYQEVLKKLPHITNVNVYKHCLKIIKILLDTGAISDKSELLAFIKNTIETNGKFLSDLFDCLSDYFDISICQKLIETKTTHSHPSRNYEVILKIIEKILKQETDPIKIGSILIRVLERLTELFNEWFTKSVIEAIVLKGLLKMSREWVLEFNVIEKLSAYLNSQQDTLGQTKLVLSLLSISCHHLTNSLEDKKLIKEKVINPLINLLQQTKDAALNLQVLDIITQLVIQKKCNIYELKNQVANSTITNKYLLLDAIVLVGTLFDREQELNSKRELAFFKSKDSIKKIKHSIDENPDNCNQPKYIRK